jgi:rod shape-determining protein MreB and related proteins
MPPRQTGSDRLYSSVVGRDIAVDLGTANTLVYARGVGVILDEPSIIAVTLDGRVIAVGGEAQRMLGRAPPNIHVARPLKDGVISDYELAELMLREFIRRVTVRRFARPRVVVCVPSAVTGVEQRAVQEAAERAGARKPAYIIEEAMAAAIGANLPIHEASGNMIVDIGGGTTEVAVISLGGIVASHSSPIAGDEFDEAIVAFTRKEHSLAIGERTAEEIKRRIASAWPLEEEFRAEVRGLDLVSGLPKTIVTSTEEMREAIDEPVTGVIDAVKYTLDRTPPELAADLMERGIYVTGGGALLHGLDVRLSAETGMPIRIARDPLYTVVLGSGRCLEQFDALKQVLVSSQAR